MRQNYLITGGAGFIGVNLVRRLFEAEKARIRILDNLSAARVGKDVMGSSPARGDQLIADPSRKWQVGESGVQVPDLPTSNAELDSTKAMLVDTYTCPR